jgi:hypothetical protein
LIQEGRIVATARHLSSLSSLRPPSAGVHGYLR